ncbi:hypothetical protein BS50DRAFT_106048 [Corynespora cassiicola Philippines]|uniref:Uncharacterized protein n=1 Tax=Corynespora cassiicola Philippines TaxID=1448308 RepID=A0A2T2NCK4_CORCC|nr:hypothetical protein BS50DRAFT_106048 [Corynespora cassiicola Philippines]
MGVGQVRVYLSSFFRELDRLYHRYTSICFCPSILVSSLCAGALIIHIGSFTFVLVHSGRPGVCVCVPPPPPPPPLQPFTCSFVSASYSYNTRLLVGYLCALLLGMDGGRMLMCSCRCAFGVACPRYAERVDGRISWCASGSGLSSLSLLQADRPSLTSKKCLVPNCPPYATAHRSAPFRPGLAWPGLAWPGCYVTLADWLAGCSIPPPVHIRRHGNGIWHGDLGRIRGRGRCRRSRVLWRDGRGDGRVVVHSRRRGGDCALAEMQVLERLALLVIVQAHVVGQAGALALRVAQAEQEDEEQL